MSDFTHARICIRHASGSVEIQAPAGEVTWLDLSGLHVLPATTSKEGRRKRRLLMSCFFLGCSAAVGVGIGFVSSGRSFSPGVRAEASALEQPMQQQAFLPDLAASSAAPAPRTLPASAPGPLPQSATLGVDPFGLKR